MRIENQSRTCGMTQEKMSTGNKNGIIQAVPRLRGSQ